MPEVRVGVSGWSFDEWKDTFYDGVKRKDWLAHYASVFPTVEVNYTFRRMMSEKTARDWVATVPDDFRFAVKAHQRITHTKRLKDPEENLPYFVQTMAPLAPKLGPVLFQLPPNLTRDDVRLSAFLEALPRELSAVFEFRNETWFDDGVYDLLRGRGAGLVLSETDEEGLPDVVTAPVLYLRLRKSDYSDTELGAWAERIHATEAHEVWAYLKHEDRSPELASALIAHLG